MWYKAKCIRDCIFQGVRRRVGDEYVGTAMPPSHFEILELNKTAPLTNDKGARACPYCGNSLPQGAATETPVQEPEPVDMEDQVEEEQAKEAAQPVSISKLKVMNKSELLEIAESMGVECGESDTNRELVAAISSKLA